MSEAGYWERKRPELLALVEELTPDDALAVLRALAATPLDHDQISPVLLSIVRDQKGEHTAPCV